MIEDKKIIHERMIKSIDEKYDKARGSFFYDATMPAAMEFEIKSKEIEVVQSKLDIENLSGEELERFIYPRTGQTRKLATKATTTVVVSGQEGSKIKIGELVASDNVNFKSLEDKVIGGSGAINLLVECEEFGVIGNVPANSINRFPVTIPGLVDVYNPETVVNGYEAETDRELRGRYYEKFQRPAKAGNKYHYEQWAKEVVGVGGVKVIPRWDGPLSVKVVVVDSNGLPADEELITNTLDHIEEERPFGANVTVVGAIPKEIDIIVTLLLTEAYTDLEVKESIKNNVKEYLKSIAFKVEYISYAQIGSIILDTEGVLDYSDLEINGDIANILVASEEVAIVGGVS